MRKLTDESEPNKNFGHQYQNPTKAKTNLLIFFPQAESQPSYNIYTNKIFSPLSAINLNTLINPNEKIDNKQ